jgi:hypothetical protein
VDAFDALDALEMVVSAFRRTGAMDLRLELIRPVDYERVAQYQQPQLAVWWIEDDERHVLATVYLLDLSREQLAAAAQILLNEIGTLRPADEEDA